MTTRQSARPGTLRTPGICGDQGYLSPACWADPEHARRLAGRLAGSALGEVTRNPHLDQAWAREAVTSPALLASVSALIGPDIAVENSFLITKQPQTAFAVPAHQDGINDRIMLDPAGAVAAWLAISDATTANGCLEVIPGSHCGGYLSYLRAAPSADHGGQRPLTTAGDFPDREFVPLPLNPGQVCLMDVRLVHRSGPNRSRHPRIGLNVRYTAPHAVTVRDGSVVELFVLTGTGW
jgi:ectoine hydroxylase-related dioxygenase (phytanoyl-CoA dioxygenase family)